MRLGLEGTLLLLFLAHNVGIFGAFYVYDDARTRYPSKVWALGWAISVYILFIVFMFFYLIQRPPVVFANIPKLSLRKKTLIYFTSFPLFIILIIILAIITK